MKVLTDNSLTVLWNRLKKGILNNRNYEPTEFSGKGYKVLEKNIQTINGVRKNILTSAMINRPNTIYEIRYDFNLGEDITIPENCVLKFDGGSVSASGSNETITGTLTKIIYKNECFKDIILAGTWSNKYISSIISNNIENIFDICHDNKIIVSLDSDIIINRDCKIPSIFGNKRKITINNTTFSFSKNIIISDLTILNLFDYVTISNGSFVKNDIPAKYALYSNENNNVSITMRNVLYTSIADNVLTSSFFQVRKCHNSNFENVIIHNVNTAFLINAYDNTSNIKVSNIEVYNAITGIYATTNFVTSISFKGLIISGYKFVNSEEFFDVFEQNGLNNSTSGLDAILTEYGVEDVIIENVYVEKAIERAFYIQSSNCTIKNISIVDTGGVKVVGHCTPETQSIAGWVENVTVTNVTIDITKVFGISHGGFIETYHCKNVKYYNFNIKGIASAEYISPMQLLDFIENLVVDGFKMYGFTTSTFVENAAIIGGNHVNDFSSQLKNVTLKNISFNDCFYDINYFIMMHSGNRVDNERVTIKNVFIENQFGSNACIKNLCNQYCDHIIFENFNTKNCFLKPTESLPCSERYHIVDFNRDINIKLIDCVFENDTFGLGFDEDSFRNSILNNIIYPYCKNVSFKLYAYDYNTTSLFIELILSGSSYGYFPTLISKFRFTGTALEGIIPAVISNKFKKLIFKVYDGQCKEIFGVCTETINNIDYGGSLLTLSKEDYKVDEEKKGSYLKFLLNDAWSSNRIYCEGTMS